jgi:molecular chaperone IbpA
MNYNYSSNALTGYRDTFSKMFKEGEEVLSDFWNVLEHTDFPFLTLTSTTNGARNFPPYNIIEQPDGKVRLEMAVAGYTKQRLVVELQGNILIIQGTPQNAVNRNGERPETDIVRHQGISDRKFTRTFEMNVNTIIENVQLNDGILTITVTTKPETKSTQKFEIK